MGWISIIECLFDGEVIPIGDIGDDRTTACTHDNIFIEKVETRRWLIHGDDVTFRLSDKVTVM